MVDAARRLPGMAFELSLTGSVQHVDSLAVVPRLLSHRTYCNSSSRSWKKRYVSELPSGFLHPVTVRLEPCRIGVVVAVLLGAELSAVLVAPELPESFPAVFVLPESWSPCDADVSADEELAAALLPNTPPKTAPRMTMTAITPPIISHNRFLDLPGATGGECSGGDPCDGLCSGSTA
jgi:hypothetical protein